MTPTHSLHTSGCITASETLTNLPAVKEEDRGTSETEAHGEK